MTFLEASPIHDFVVERKRLRDQISGIPLVRVPALKRWRPTFLVSYGVATALTLFLMRKQFDILHIHQLSDSALPAAVAALRLGKPVAVKLTSAGAVGDLAKLRQRAHPRLASALLRRINRFIALTTELQQELLDAGVSPERIAVIPNGVDTNAFRPAGSHDEQMALRTELSLPRGTLFVFVGRLVAKKRVDLLLRSWVDVRSTVADAHLVIVGDGPLSRPLREQARQAQLEDSVHFVGETSRVADYLRAADVFVLPSVSEGLSNALLEAMSTGLATVITDSVGARNVISDRENGRLFRDETPEGLTQILVELATSPSARRALGDTARATVEATFGLDNVACRYQEMYDALLGRAGTSVAPARGTGAPIAR